VAIYTGRATTRTLAELTGVDYQSLDRQYEAFMGQVESDSEAKTDDAPANAVR
jgi:hypothetical protein